MADKGFRLGTRHVLGLTAVVMLAGLGALLVVFGEQLLWASRHVLVPRYSAFTEIDNSLIAADCELSTCSFNGLAFDVPTSLIDSAKIVRSSPSVAWLAFEDETRMLHIPLTSYNIRTEMATVPADLNDLPTPILLEVCLATASDDFSLAMGKTELNVLDWALKNRSLLRIDEQHMERYSRISSGDVEAILISAAPVSIDSHRRLRSILMWESRDRQDYGAIWFGDSRIAEVGWMDAVARSFAVVNNDRLSSTELLKLSDAELLAKLEFYSLSQNE